jgi:hypothetical protein
MYSMLAALDSEYRVRFSSTATSRAAYDTHCAICKVAPAPRGLLTPERTAEWLADYGHMLGGVRDGARQAPAEERPHSNTKLPDDSTRCLTCESQLRPACAVPDHLLRLVRDQLSAEELYFLEDQLLFSICGLCAVSDHVQSESATSIFGRYVDVRFGTDADLLARSGYGEVTQALARRIESAVSEASA